MYDHKDTSNTQYCLACIFSGAIAFSGAHFGAGNGPIYLDNVDCSGSENNLTNCDYTYNVICANDHSQDAGVRCQGKLG